MAQIPRPRGKKLLPWLLLAALAYVVSPVDLIPDFIPGLGQGDDAMVILAVVAKALQSYFAARPAPGVRPV